MEYFKIKRRMVELVALLNKDATYKPEEKTIRLNARHELDELKKNNRLAWLEVQ
tara:strand:+ start:284 stop:445 length:162 start_codon:yes stop_codon:yes gene_type:complete